MTFRKNNNLKSPWSGDPNGEQTPAMPRLEAGMAKLFALRRPATGRVEATASPPTGLRDSRDPGGSCPEKWSEGMYESEDRLRGYTQNFRFYHKTVTE